MSGNPAEESAAWHDWQHERTQRVLAAESTREAIQDAREEEERLARIEARHDPDFEAFRAAAIGEPPRTIGAVLADLAAIPDGPWWDPEAEPGSAANPVRLDAPQPAAQRSRPVSDVQRLLDRAAAVDAEFRQHERRWHEREIARRRPAGCVPIGTHLERKSRNAPQPAAQRSRPVSDVQRLLDRAAAVDAEFRRHEARWHEAKLRGEISR